MRAMSWFEDCTYFGDNMQSVNMIKNECMAQGYIPLFDYHPEHGWVFHTIFPPDGTVSKKKIAQMFERKKDHVIQCEKDLEQGLARFYRDCGIPCKQQMRCSAGVADIVTSCAVIEVEYTLTRPKAFEAIGQVLAYRQAINPDARAEIVSVSISEDAMPIVYAAIGVGVRFSIWSKDLEEPCLI